MIDIGFCLRGEGLKESGRTREGFDISLHVRSYNLQPDAEQALQAWKKMGFTRVIIYIE